MAESTSSVTTTESVTIMHISDLHFGNEAPDKVKAVIDLADEHRPSFICVTGDIVNFPRPANFKKAADFINRIGTYCNGNVFLVPGNHDVLFGGYCLGLFKHYFRQEPEFAKHLELKKQDVCVFGVDSTFPHHNTGKFGSNAQQAFQNHISRLESELGKGRFGRAFKVVLLHHHPVPTLSSAVEKMLYMKNAGVFLNLVTQKKVNLVLHGHQHDPCYLSLNYNVGGDEQSLVVLSAGTATKAQTEVGAQSHSLNTQLHIVEIESSGIVVESFCYDKTHRVFDAVRRVPKRIDQGTVAYQSMTIKSKIASNGDLETSCERTLSAHKGKSVSELRIAFGVDPRSAAADFRNLNFTLSRNGKIISASDYKVVEDKPHRKVIMVVLNPAISVQQEKISWNFSWPGGWENLLADNKDSGRFAFNEEHDSYRYELELAPPLQITNFIIHYPKPERVQILHHELPNKRGFEIQKPPRYDLLRFDIFTK